MALRLAIPAGRGVSRYKPMADIVIRFCTKTLSGGSSGFSGYRNLQFRDQVTTDRQEGFRWQHCCPVDRGNCCTTLTFEAYKIHATPEAAMSETIDLGRELCLCVDVGESGTLQIGTRTWPSAVYQGASHSHRGTKSRHQFSFILSQAT